jgi:class 3 adenylate cyclase/tetratricopeptide (TPR) repeat protein
LASKGKKIVGERRHITALFADVSGYTELAERLDPEEIKDIMSHLFEMVTKVILKYEGCIEKFAGDAVMALFGIPRSHEDDPIRAIRAAQEIHRTMGALSLKYQTRIGHPLAVHIGINTGLVVTGEIHSDDGTHQVAGDTVNVASRLCDLAKADETLVGQTTASQAEGFYFFERLEPVKVKNRTQPVQVCRVLGAKELPSKTHRISGLRADLIGRDGEMAELEKAAGNLLEGIGSVISIFGEAGTGKSRLIAEFKSCLDQGSIKWYEGHAYAYAQNVPYYPLIDLLNRMFQIEESDPLEMAREKAESMIKNVLGDGDAVLPYLGEILSIPYLEEVDINPDAWKANLHMAFLTLMGALVRRAPTVIALEDLHWADPSSLELLRILVAKLNYPALFLCIYRPPLTIFSPDHIRAMEDSYQEVRLKDLVPSESQLLVGSLLKTESIPLSLQRVIQAKVGGNPFYVEEVINSLIESGTLAAHDGDWRFTETSQEIMVPATIQGVITARLDRLNAAAKEILQEASVIGRTFYYEILESITIQEAPIDNHLHRLQELDLIRVRSTHPDVEYSFKHALIQEAVYDGLLKRQRQDIHERVGQALEKFCQARSLESWETLAFHFRRGRSVQKAVDYLVRSGEKSVKLYALEEANQYYQEAYDLLSQNQSRSIPEDVLLIDLLIEWCMVFYYQGRFEAMAELLLVHVKLAESLDDKARKGVYYAWLGHATFWQGAKLQDSYRYLHQALALGDQTDNQQVIGLACSFLIKTCAEMGYLEEAVRFEKRTQEMLGLFESNPFFYITYYSGKGYIGWFLGDRQRLHESAQGLLDYGQKISSLRCQMVGNLLMGFRHFVDLDMELAVEHTQKVITQGDPYHAIFGKLLLGMFLVQRREFERAEDLLTQVIAYSETEQTEYLKTTANLFLGVSLAAQGQLAQGIRLVESVSREFMEFHRSVFASLSEFILGNIFLQIFQGSGKKDLAAFCKNFGFLMKNLPFAGKKAERHLTKAVQLARQTGARGFLGQPCLQLGVLFKLRGRRAKAKEYVSEAIRVFEECGFEAHLNHARELLDTLT